MNPFQEWNAMSKGMARGDYPEFVTGRTAGDEFPVFIDHRVRSRTFRFRLEHLRWNGYQTLDTRDLSARLDSGKPFSGKEVLLTFDDGLSDLYSVIFPLLKTFGAKAVVFIAPYWIGREGFIGWEQAAEMHSSGFVDFQPHGFTHRRIPVSPEVIGFYHPRMRIYRKWQIPMVESLFAKYGEPQWGMPIYRSQSRLSDSPQYIGGDALDQLCVGFVENTGRERFFSNPSWKKKLNQFINNQKAFGQYKILFETKNEHLNRIEEEITLSREAIEKHLPGKEVIAFAYPFHEQSVMAESLLEKAGFRFVFGGIGAKPDIQKTPMRFRRTSGDFIMRLPGKGRRSLVRIMIEKAVRRVFVGVGY